MHDALNGFFPGASATDCRYAHVMYQARSLPDTLKSGWRSWTVNAVLMIAAVAALFAVHA
ncbi:hypothetical protein ASD10_04180 [Aeromicrobium sp. Root472D3]|nr:hypothetical protein ASD10_04180 [Aeromicrobium sp. Root472D3]